MALAGCSLLGRSDSAPERGAPELDARGLRAMAQAVMDRRAAAVLDGDWTAFARDLADRDPAFVAKQRQWFDNMRQLPLEQLSFRVEAATWAPLYADRSWGEDVYIPYVEQRMQLRGFDRVPVDTTYGITFAPYDGRWAIVADTDVRDRVGEGSQEAPWDLVPIQVARTPGVLGIFDKDADLDLVDEVMASAQRSIRVVSRTLPVRWDRHAVLYAVTDRAVLERVSHVPGGDVDELTALAFPVYDDSEDPTRVAAMRVLVHPDAVDQVTADHGAVLTHEMTHVAVAAQEGGGPVWVNEGLAEWVATDGARPRFVYVGRDLAERAAAGVDELPNSYTFNTVDQWWNYSLALAACDYVAETHGEATLWRLWKALQHNDWTATDEQQDRVLRRVIGIGRAELARQAGRRLVELSPYLDLRSFAASGTG